MLTVTDVISTLRAKNVKLSDQELRHLPCKDAFIYPRVSSPAQVRESRESIHEITELLKLAKQDGFHSDLIPNDVEKILLKIQNDITCKEVITNGQITIDFRDLGISGRLSSKDRPGLNYLIDSIKEGRIGTVYVTEASRLTREQNRITPYNLLELFRQNSVRVRTPEYIKNPRIQRDWEDLRDDLEEAIEESKIMARRLNRKRRQKAARGEYAGGPVPPGLIVEIKDIEASGHNVYGKFKKYKPHAEIVERALRALVQYRFRKMEAHRALGGLMYPLFPPELKYMERLSGLRKAKKIDGVGYLISPAMIKTLANIPELIGIFTWGDLEPRRDNHDKVVPVDLWLEVHQGFNDVIKPRGHGAHHEPLEWNGLLWCCNHDELKRISGHAAKGAYRCQSDYIQGRCPVCLDIAAHLLDKPLTGAVLQQLDFTPFAEEVLMQLEADVSNFNIEEEQRNKEMTRLVNRLNKLKSYLGDADEKKEQTYWEQIDATQLQLDELKSRSIPLHRVQTADYEQVRSFLARINEKWATYSRTFRNRIISTVIERVEISHKSQDLTATIRWKTGQVQVISIQRPQPKGNLESWWNEQEKGILKMLWPSSSQDAIMAALPGRTWSAIAHQAQAHKLKRTPPICRSTAHRTWSVDDDRRGKELFATGMLVKDIADNLQRTITAVSQRASSKGWTRLSQITTVDLSNQRSEVPNGINSGIVLGGQAITFQSL